MWLYYGCAVYTHVTDITIFYFLHSRLNIFDQLNGEINHIKHNNDKIYFSDVTCCANVSTISAYPLLRRHLIANPDKVSRRKENKVFVIATPDNNIVFIKSPFCISCVFLRLSKG
jgi:hypothetical protein